MSMQSRSEGRARLKPSEAACGSGLGRRPWAQGRLSPQEGTGPETQAGLPAAHRTVRLPEPAPGHGGGCLMHRPS